MAGISLRGATRAAYLCCEGIASSSSSYHTSSRPPHRSTSRQTPSMTQTVPQPRHAAHNTSRTFSSSSRTFMPRQKDLYTSLNIPKNATKQQIKAKFYELSKKLHPDAPGGSAEKFHEINEAYETLGDESKRRQYDDSLRSPSYAESSGGYGGSAGYGGYGGQYAHSPQYDPLNRRPGGPHAAWSTRRPPPKGPATGHGPYNPYGRHTPPGWQGASSGTYGDPYANVREQFKQGFADVRSGRNWGFTAGGMNGGMGGAGGAGGANRRPGSAGMGSGSGPWPPRGKPEADSGSAGRIAGTFILVFLIIAFGGTIGTAKAEPLVQRELDMETRRRLEEDRRRRTERLEDTKRQMDRAYPGVAASFSQGLASDTERSKDGGEWIRRNTEALPVVRAQADQQDMGPR